MSGQYSLPFVPGIEVRFPNNVSPPPLITSQTILSTLNFPTLAVFPFQHLSTKRLPRVSHIFVQLRIHRR